MKKEVSRGQFGAVISRVATQVDWDQLDGDKLQNEVLSLPVDEFGRRFTAFLKAGARFILGGLKIACAAFNPADFIGTNWTFWKGPKDGNGLEGEEERDKASLTLTEVDFASADLLTCLEKGESSITGEEKIVRLQKLGRTIYGTTVAMGLWQDYQQNKKAGSVLEKLYQQRGVTYIDFPGDVLRVPGGRRCVLVFSRDDDGSWRWDYVWLAHGWNGPCFSAVGPAQQVSSS